MSFTRADLRDIAREEITVDPSGGIWGDTKLNRYINQAHRKLQKDLGLGFPANEDDPFEISTDGSLEYALPSDLGTINVVKIGNQVLDATTKEELLLHSELDSGGNPGRYYIYGSNIGFDLKPNGSTVKMYYNRIIADFTNDTTVSTLPDTDEVKQAIATYVKYLAWKKQKGQRATALEAKEGYEDALKEIREEYWNFEKRSFNLDRVPHAHHVVLPHDHF